MPKPGSRQARGYTQSHVRERAKWEPKVAAGAATCARCQLPITPGTEWHLDHNDDRTGYVGVSHAHCNTAEGGRKGAAVTNAKWSTTVREW